MRTWPTLFCLKRCSSEGTRTLWLYNMQIIFSYFFLAVVVLLLDCTATQNKSDMFQNGMGFVGFMAYQHCIAHIRTKKDLNPQSRWRLIMVWNKLWYECDLLVPLSRLLGRKRVALSCRHKRYDSGKCCPLLTPGTTRRSNSRYVTIMYCLSWWKMKQCSSFKNCSETGLPVVVDVLNTILHQRRLHL